MAETKRMTAEQVVSWVVQRLMEAEVSELIGAERGERRQRETCS